MQGDRWMRVLVTGATGLLGSDICRVLGSMHELVGWTRSGRPIGKVRVTAVDVRQEGSVRQEMERSKPEVVIHCAALSDVDLCEREEKLAWAVNVAGVEHVARAAKEAGAWLIAISTDYVFDGQLGRPYREDDPTHPVNAYGRTKEAGEQAALRECRRTLVVRVSGLFGSARANFVTENIHRLRKGEAVPAVTDQTYTPSYTRDLAEGIAELLRLGKRTCGTLHLANGGGASRIDVAGEIAAALGVSKPVLVPRTWAQLGRPARRPSDSRLDCSRFQEITGRPLRSWQEGLRAFVEEGAGL